MPTTKTCPVCLSEVRGLLTSPATCVDPEDNTLVTHGSNKRACSECWELHVSREVEIRPALSDSPRDGNMTNIECIACPSTLCRADLKRYSHVGTADRYEMKQTAHTRRKCQNRCQGVQTPFQQFDRGKDGRIFTCELCTFATCVDCDRAEHTGESCQDYQARLQQSEATEQKSNGVFEVDKEWESVRQRKPKTSAATEKVEVKRCPNCSVPFFTEKNCGYTICAPGSVMEKAGVTSGMAGCGFRFCSGCLVPWAGDGGVYLVGRLAHLPSCKHYFHLCSACNRKAHPHESCDDYATRLKPIADAEDRKNKCASGERHWETSHGALLKLPSSASMGLLLQCELGLRASGRRHWFKVLPCIAQWLWSGRGGLDRGRSQTESKFAAS